MISVIAHIEAVLKEAKLRVVYENDDKEQSPSSVVTKALVDIGDVDTLQTSDFIDTVRGSITVYETDLKKGILLSEKVRGLLVNRRSEAIVGVVCEGITIGENSLNEKVRAFKINFKITA